LNLRDTLGLLAGMPDFLETVASRFPGEKALEAGPGEGLCFVEQVWHLADLERCQGGRIRRILSEDRPALADFDGAREAREGRYRERSLAAGLAAFRQAREENLAALRSVAGDDWSRPATQEGVGELTLADVARRMAEHDASHRGEIGDPLGEARREEAPRWSSSGVARALVLLLAVPLLGCPYNATFPIGSPADTPRDARLLGQWRCVGSSDEKAFHTTIAPVEDRQYSIVLTVSGEEPFESRAHGSTVAGGAVLNVRSIKDGKPVDEWNFARYLLPTPSSLVLDVAEDTLLKGLEQTPAAIKKAFEGPQANEIFQPFFVCTRIEDDKKP
jgi:hypothetical protein